LALQTLNQNEVTLEAPDLAKSDQKSVVRVLHVDDDSSILEISKLMLIDLDSSFDIDNVCCVEEAFKKLSRQQYDVVISDYEMPNKNGLQFLKELRDKKNRIPFILFTGKGREEVVIEALNLGADHYVNKQGSPETVYSELAHLVSSAVEKQRAKFKNENDSLALHNVDDAIIYSDANYIIGAWNKAAEELFGYSSIEVLQKSILDFFGKIQKKPLFDDLMRELRATGQFQGEVIYQNKSGQLRNGQLHIVSIQSEDGKFLGNVAVCNDITERRKIGEALRKSEEEYSALFSNMIDGFSYGKMIYDENEKPIDFAYLQVNDAFERITGLKKESVIGKKVTQVIPGIVDDYPELFETYRRVAFTGKKEKFELFFKPLGLWLNISVFCPQKGYLAAMFEDITERKKAEELLWNSQEQLKAIIMNAPIGIATTAPNFIILSANEAFCRMLGYSEDELKKLTFRDFTYPEDVTESSSNMVALNCGKLPFFSQQKRYIRKDGVVIDGKVTVSVIRDKESKPALYIAELEDITERKATEEYLNQTERKKKSFLSEPTTVIEKLEITLDKEKERCWT